MKPTFFRMLVVMLALSSATVALRAEDLGTVRARMAQRIANIDTLKTQGALGENNQGFLEVRSVLAEASAVSAAENADRALVYAALAKKTGATPVDVGKARANQLAGLSAVGVWLQRDNGEWYKK
jgi:uncharacterized protein